MGYGVASERPNRRVSIFTRNRCDSARTMSRRLGRRWSSHFTSSSSVAGVVGWVDVNALHLIAVIGQQGFERVQIVALDEQVAGAGLADRAVAVAVDEAVGDVLIVIDDGFFADPVERGHGLIILVSACSARAGAGSAFNLKHA